MTGMASRLAVQGRVQDAKDAEECLEGLIFSVGEINRTKF